MLFSRRLRRYVSRKGAPQFSCPDPYAPNSPAYAERHTSHVTELPSGLVRVDIGEPVKRLACEPQPTRRNTGKAPPAPAAPPPVSTEPPATAPVGGPKVRPKAGRKAHSAITRDA